MKNQRRQKIQKKDAQWYIRIHEHTDVSRERTYADERRNRERESGGGRGRKRREEKEEAEEDHSVETKKRAKSESERGRCLLGLFSYLE